jgi:ABC-type nitrate/sulfonate/bicarbonate transport system substrate-binding protein
MAPAHSNDRDPSVIRIGTIAGTVVTGTPIETLAHDRILRSQLARLGKRIEVVPMAIGTEIIQALEQKNIDIAPATEMVVFHALRNPDVRCIAFIGYSYVSVVARQASEPRGLVGRKIAVIPGTIGDQTLSRMLVAAELARDQIDRVNLKVGAMPAAIESGQVDAISAWEPTPQNVLRKHPEYRVLFRNSSANLLVVREGGLRLDSEPARMIAAAVVRAFHWLGAHESHRLRAATWAMSRGTEQKVSSEAALDAVRTVRASLTDILGLPLLPRSWHLSNGEGQRTFEELQAQGVVPSDLHWEEVRSRIDPSLLQRVVSNPARYRLEDFDYDE